MTMHWNPKNEIVVTGRIFGVDNLGQFEPGRNIGIDTSSFAGDEDFPDVMTYEANPTEFLLHVYRETYFTYAANDPLNQFSVAGPFSSRSYVKIAPRTFESPADFVEVNAVMHDSQYQTRELKEALSAVQEAELQRLGVAGLIRIIK